MDKTICFMCNVNNSRSVMAEMVLHWQRGSAFWLLP